MAPKNAIMTKSWIITSACYDKKAYLWQNNKPHQKGINRRQKRKRRIQEKLRKKNDQQTQRVRQTGNTT